MYLLCPTCNPSFTSFNRVICSVALSHWFLRHKAVDDGDWVRRRHDGVTQPKRLKTKLTVSYLTVNKTPNFLKTFRLFLSDAHAVLTEVLSECGNTRGYNSFRAYVLWLAAFAQRHPIGRLRLWAWLPQRTRCQWALAQQSKVSLSSAVVALSPSTACYRRYVLKFLFFTKVIEHTSQLRTLYRRIDVLHCWRDSYFNSFSSLKSFFAC